MTRWEVLEWLRKHSKSELQKTCMTTARGGSALLGRRPTGAAVFAGASPCTLRTCPNCGPRLQAERRAQVEDLTDRARLAGHAIYLVTFTIRHTRRDRLADLLDALLSCWRGLTKGRAWHEGRAEAGVHAFLRVIEVKHGRHGWHPHVHALVFAREGDEGTERFLTWAQERWAVLVSAAGYRADAAAQDFRRAAAGDLDRVAGYFAKDFSRDLAWEVTGQDTKRGGGSLTPAEILASAVAGDLAAARLWAEYEVATKGRQLWASPRGYADLLGARPERSVEAVTRDELPTEYLARVRRGEYAALARVPGLRGDTARVIETGADPGVLVWWLHGHGIRSTPLDHAPQEGARLAPVPAPEGGPSWLACV